MNYTTHSHIRRRTGSSIAEVSIAVVIASMVMICVVQLLTMAARQHRLIDQRWLASIEVGNLMEELMSRPFDQIASDSPPTIELSEICQQTLPDAQLQLEIVPPDASEVVRRITVRLDWQNHARQRTQPVQLVAWKYRQQESQP